MHLHHVHQHFGKETQTLSDQIVLENIKVTLGLDDLKKDQLFGMISRG